MSYLQPNNPIIVNPEGVDICIQNIQQSLKAGLPWLKHSFGRAYEFKEKDSSDKIVKIPKCYDGKSDYIDVRPNDKLQSMSFIVCTGPEQTVKYDPFSINYYSRDIAVIFWIDLRKAYNHVNGIYTEKLKNEVHQLLKYECFNVNSVNSYTDERIEDVYKGFSINDVKTQFMMYPYASFRFDLTIGYTQPCQN